LVLGLTVTAAVALLQQSNVKNTRQLTFDAAAAVVLEELVDGVNTNIQHFESGVNFVSATHPGPLDEFRAYFQQSGAIQVEGDPGFVLIEAVPTKATADLIDRERALGNDGFSPFLLPTDQPERLMITRTVFETGLFGLPVIGLDLSSLQGDELLTKLTRTGGTGIFVLPSDDLVGFIGDRNSIDLAIEDYADYTALIASEVFDRNGDLIGFAVQSQPIRELLSRVPAANLAGLNVELYVDDVADPLDGRIAPAAPPMADADLRATREVTAAALDWRIEVWASESYGPPTGLFDQAWVWIIGVMSTVAAYAASVRRQLNRRRLDRARFELAHARTLAMTDGLTGLLNRNGLVEAARTLGPDTPATVFFIDLDGFKAVNDTDGHEHGDEVLRAVAERLRSIFRSEDLVSRLGGDEFVVFTKGASGKRPQQDDHIASIGRRITTSVADVDDRVTCSLGVASRTGGEQTDIKDLIRAADAAMYEAKRSGGNQFSLADRAAQAQPPDQARAR
jgi:diguanylate cyclase (GGDEF)-like protein